MTVFIILATLLVAGALLLVIPPMLGQGRREKERAARQRQAETVLVVLREQLGELEAEHAAGHLGDEEHQRAREELEKRALEEGRYAEQGNDASPSLRAAVAVIVAVPVLAGGIYMWLGEPGGLDPAAAVASAPDQGHQITPEQMKAMVVRLAERLESQPDDEQGWLMLGRSFAVMQDFAGATATWARIGAKIPNHPDILADWADLLAGAAGRRFEGAPDSLIDRALKLNPSHVKALALAGTSAFQRQDFAQASALWERILANVPPTDDAYRAIVGSINDARTRGGLPPYAPQDGGAVAQVAAASDVLSASGRIALSDEFAGKVEPDAVVFVFARPVNGGMPLAALRMRAGDLPAEFDFTNAQRMAQGPLPDQISIGARLSRQGTATAQSGDLEGKAVTVSPDAKGIEVRIDSIRP